MPFFITTDNTGQIDAIYSSERNNVPAGASHLRDEDFAEIQRHGGNFGLFDMVGGRPVLSERASPETTPGTAETQALRAEVAALKEALLEMAESVPEKTPRAAAALQRLTARQN